MNLTLSNLFIELQIKAFEYMYDWVPIQTHLPGIEGSFHKPEK